MKSILSLALIGFLIFSGCENFQDPNLSSSHLKKGSVNSNGQVQDPGKFDIIPLPEKSPIYLDSLFSVTKIINGLLGGVITLDETYISKEGKLVTILVEMVFPPLSFSGQREITIAIDDSLAIMHCGPSMNFNRQILVQQTFTGLELSKYNPDDIDYAYINENGTYSVVPYDFRIVNKELGIVTVVNAKLNHFSRYGWVRKGGNPH